MRHCNQCDKDVQFERGHYDSEIVHIWGHECVHGIEARAMSIPQDVFYRFTHEPEHCPEIEDLPLEQS